MKALITGASGFVGRHLRAHLEAAGDEVVSSDRVQMGDGLVLDIEDPASVAAALGAARPEVVYHLAGWSDVGGSWAHPVEVLKANAEGTMNLLEGARAVGADRVLVASSADVYGIVPDERLPITEEHPLRPVSPYAVSKVAADFIALQAFLGHGQSVIRARAFNHLGPGQTDKFVASSIAARIAANERDGSDEVPVGNLAARRDFTDVRDVVRAYRLLVEHAEGGEAYNVCSGRTVAVQELADQLLALASRPMRLVIDPDRYRPVDVPSVLGTNERLCAATGWSPEIELTSTLADLLAYWRDQGTHG